MSRQDNEKPTGNDEILERIHSLQDEIFEREEKISELVGAFEEHPAIAAAVERHRENRQVRLVAGLKRDWDTLLSRSRAVTEDDLEITAVLVHFVGDLLAVQPDGIAERWIERLEEHLESHRAQVS